MRHKSCSESVTGNRFSLPLLLLLVCGVSSGAVAQPAEATPMPAKKQCRTFRSAQDFQTFLSPASRQAPGVDRSTGLTDPLTDGGAARSVPPWRIELLRRPLRRIVAWHATESLYRGMPVKDYTETLECGHEQDAFYFDGQIPPKRRRCRECGRRP